MDEGRKTSGTETADLLGKRGHKLHVHVGPLCPLSHGPSGRQARGTLCPQRGWCHSQGILRLGNPSLIKAASSKPAGSLPWRRHCFHCPGKQTICPLPKGDTVFICQGCLLNKHPWKIVQEQGVTRLQKFQRPLGELSLTQPEMRPRRLNPFPRATQ